MSEHGGNGDITALLRSIFQAAIYIKGYPELLGGLSHTPQNDYLTLSSKLRIMEKNILNIGKILSIEFEEMES